MSVLMCIRFCVIDGSDAMRTFDFIYVCIKYVIHTYKDFDIIYLKGPRRLEPLSRNQFKDRNREFSQNILEYAIGRVK